MTNRLQRETSPYLRQHADNPVDWYPWGEEALARARREDRPILLSVGYSACHWCHVMAHESFEDPEIARRMNEWFVNVKVDREERPDLDQIYQGVVALLGRGGGWPLTVFLLPDLRPFFGGTYFPKTDRYGIPGFGRLLEALHKSYAGQRQEVEAQAREFQAGLEHIAVHGLDAPPAALKAEDLVRAAERLERAVDRVHGGFGQAPKFPNPSNVQMLLRAWRRSGKEALKSAVEITLERMARGGVYDQLGGGFHRYSVDERWLVPHFEKMLYDNAQLLALYAEAHQAGLEPRALWKKTVEETAEYVRREMTSPEGGFYAAQDADSEGEEGKFFVWTEAEIDQRLSAEQAELLELAFNVTREGNFEHGGLNVLEAKKEMAELTARSRKSEEEVRRVLDEARAVLFRAREERVKPGRDDKVLAGWNGLMIRGLSVAGRVFGRADWIAMARGAADFLHAQMWREGRLLRSFQEGRAKIDAFIEDYGDVASGLAALYQATFEPRYLEAAVAVADKAVELFWAEEKQAYLAAPRGQQDLVCATYAVHDNAFPSGASALTEAQVALAAITGEQRFLEQAEKYLSRLRDEMTSQPFGFGHLWLAADAFLDGAAALTVVGEDPAAAELAAAANRAYAPTVALCRLPAGAAPAVLKHAAQGREQVEGAAAYLCRRFTCEAPMKDAAQVEARLRRKD
ncbi:MAG TPA: thioredoxin domain-containing protein [Myxococcales bacterium]|nr:thioredoxin domain-containing protein [Myxococcales bacterium]